MNPDQKADSSQSGASELPVGNPRVLELNNKFKEVLLGVEQGKTRKRTLLVISFDYVRRANAYSDLAPIGTASQGELEEAFHGFVKEQTGVEHFELLDMAMKEPDKKKHGFYWDELTTEFATLHGGTLLGVKIMADDHGIQNAEWYLTRPQEKTPIRINNFFKKAATLFTRH